MTVIQKEIGNMQVKPKESLFKGTAVPKIVLMTFGLSWIETFDQAMLQFCSDALCKKKKKKKRRKKEFLPESWL